MRAQAKRDRPIPVFALLTSALRLWKSSPLLPAAHGECKSLGNLSEFEAELQSAGGKLVVVDFSATWCGPCKMIKPFFHSLCEKFADVIFIEIDVDDAQDVAAHCDVKCMPTFQFYKNGKKVQEFSGANKEKLEETIKHLV
ncbi:PREDICTED: thioredoxin [Tinamus guttatus]|nr:PREDICTED: thioredoxin [Tinamus guttatus]